MGVKLTSINNIAHISIRYVIFIDHVAVRSYKSMLVFENQGF